MFASWLSDKSVSEPFPERLAQQAAELCRRLSAERERELAHARLELQEERDRLKAENVRLQSELTAQKETPCIKEVAHHPIAAQPQVPVLASPSVVTSQLLGRREAQSAKALTAPVGELHISEEEMAGSHEAEGKRRAFQLAVISSDQVEAADSNLFVLRKVYRDLDRRKLGRVCVQDIVARTQRRFQGNRIPELQSAIQEVNKQLAGRKNPKVQMVDPLEMHPHELTFEGFQYLILQRNLDESLPATVALTIRDIREFYVTWTTEVMILEKTRVDKDELDANLSRDKIPVWLEPTVGVLIMSNALCIGLSLDYWEGSSMWTIVETAFSLFFCFELILKLHLVGWFEHFFGPGLVWNWFDLAIVVIALVGICMEVFSDKSELNTLTVIRLIRLVRMARLVRLLRMKVFKELALMVNGVIGGLKTMFWAFVFLTVLIFILGVFMRQVVTDECKDEALALAVSNSTQVSCFVRDNHAVLFGSVSRSMFTVFRCFIGDCTDQKGQPIAVELMVHFGHVYTVLYVSVVCFVLFGVGGLRRVHKSFKSRFSRSNNSCPRQMANSETEMMEMAVSRPVFEAVMSEPAVVGILEDLEINVTDRSKLFDIIDSNGSGSLDVGEIIEGLMKLRGPADKGDIVCASLMVRSVQRHLRRLDAEMQERHRVLERLVKTQAKIVKSLSAHGCSMTVKSSRELVDSDSSCFGV